MLGEQMKIEDKIRIIVTSFLIGFLTVVFHHIMWEREQIGVSPNGKAWDFGSYYCRFKSCHPCMRYDYGTWIDRGGYVPTTFGYPCGGLFFCRVGNKEMKKLQNKLQEIPLANYIVFSIVIILIYSIAEFIVSSITGIEHSTLTTCVYAFFGTEIASCAFIKVYKIKRENSLWRSRKIH